MPNNLTILPSLEYLSGRHATINRVVFLYEYFIALTLWLLCNGVAKLMSLHSGVLATGSKGLLIYNVMLEHQETPNLCVQRSEELFGLCPPTLKPYKLNIVHYRDRVRITFYLKKKIINGHGTTFAQTIQQLTGKLQAV